MKKWLILFTIGALLVPVLAGAQLVATRLVAESEDLPGGPAGEAISGINNPAANRVGGYHFGLTTEGAEGTISRFWGNPAGGAGFLLRSEATIGIFEQNNFESFSGIADSGDIAYSPSCTNTESGSTGLDGVWLSDTPIAVEEEPYPYLADWFWSFGSRPGTTAGGLPYFVGGITDVLGGSTQNRGLFFGLDAQPILLGGMMVDGLDQPLSASSTVSFDYRYSANGTNYIAEVQTEAASTANNHVVVSGSLLLIGGDPVSEGSPIPESAGGMPGENWDNFDFMGITETGQYFFTGDTDGPTDSDEIVVMDGMIVWREGDVIDGYVVSGSIESAYINETGDLALVWDIDVDADNLEALFFNGEMLLKETDPVDWTGDGEIDPDVPVDAFTGIASLAISERDPTGVVAIYFTADVDVPAPPAPAGTAEPILDPEEAGSFEPEEEGSRDVLEGGFVLFSEQVVPVMLARFDVVASSDGVDVNWTAHGQLDGAFEVVAERDGSSWNLDVVEVGPGQYTAHDDNASGSVTYSLYYRSGTDRFLMGRESVSTEIPVAGVRLLGAYPNPFNPQTKVAFSVGHAQHVRVSVYALDGRLVSVIADQTFEAGRHDAVWDGRDLNGTAVPSGTYVARVAGGDGFETGKLMLVK